MGAPFDNRQVFSNYDSDEHAFQEKNRREMKAVYDFFPRTYYFSYISANESTARISAESPLFGHVRGGVLLPSAPSFASHKYL